MAKIVLNDRSLKQEKIDEFEQGDRPDGSAIGQYRSLSYQMFKMRLNPKAGGDVDLILTGAFSKGMFPVEKKERAFIFKSTDKKSLMLQKRYGKDIMGLNQETFDEKQKEDYAPKLIREIKRITGF